MKLIVTVRFRWWTQAYLYGLGLFCRLTGREPDIDRITERIILEQHLPVASWYNTAFYGLSLALVIQARGNVTKIWPAGFERWDGSERWRLKRQ